MDDLSDKSESMVAVDENVPFNLLHSQSNYWNI